MWTSLAFLNLLAVLGLLRLPEASQRPWLWILRVWAPSVPSQAPSCQNLCFPDPKILVGVSAAQNRHGSLENGRKAWKPSLRPPKRLMRPSTQPVRPDKWPLRPAKRLLRLAKTLWGPATGFWGLISGLWELPRAIQSFPFCVFPERALGLKSRSA